MEQSSQSKYENRQWRIIIWSSLFLIFGKGIGLWFYHLLGMDQAYTASVNLAKKAGLVETAIATQEATAIPVEHIIDVKNDTLNEYTIESKPVSGQLNFSGASFSSGQTKRFTIRPIFNPVRYEGTGTIVFTSAPMTGNNNTTCQEIHMLNYDLKSAKDLTDLNLSAISSKMDCKENF